MTEKSKSRAKAHHVLPQFYLRAWADGQGRVAMLDRSGREVMTGPKRLAVESEFYTVRDPAGRKDSSVEEALAHWDGRGAAAHRALLAGHFPPSDEQRIEFGLWLGLQWLRGRSSRQTGREVYDLVSKLLIQTGIEERPKSDSKGVAPRAVPEGLGPGIEVPDLTGLPKELKEILRDPDRYHFEPSPEEQMLHMLRGVPMAAEPFLEAEWHLVRFEAPVLLTSDEPIVLSRLPKPGNEFLGLGPKNADELFIPLSPTHCLMFLHTRQTGREAVHDRPLSEADEINLGSIENWWRQLFRSPVGPPFPRDYPPLPDQQVVVG